MPKIRPVSFDPRCVSMSVERDAKRSSGIHLSSIIKDRLVTAGVERKTTGRPFTPQEQHLIFERGFLWERMVAEFCDTDEWIKRCMDDSASKHFAAGMRELPSELVRPGECSLDGIYMTPDALDMKSYWVEEWKATAMRAKGFDIEARRLEWIWQAGSYAHVFGMTQAVIRVWHVSENVISSFHIAWTADEIRDNWTAIKDHYDFMRSRDDRIRVAGSTAG